MTNLLPALMRTGVPIVYALLIRLGLGHLLVNLGMPADDTTTWVTYIATALLAALIYVLLRLAERLEPRFGILLGWIGAPQYATTVDDDLEKWRSATKAEVIEELGKIKDEILGHITDLLTSTTATAAPAAVTATTPPAAAAETATPDLNTLTRAELVKLLPAGVKAGKKTKAQLIAAITAANTSQAS